MLTYKDVNKIKFPVYVLPSDNWYTTDGVLFLDREVLDEKNMPGKTLGIRRMQCGRRDLFKLKKALMNYPQILRCKTKHFIDSKGMPFTYVKTQSSMLKAYQIKSIELKETASLLWVHGVPHPFTLERPPLNNPKWVRLLHLGDHPWIVYDYVNLPTKTTYRRV